MANTMINYSVIWHATSLREIIDINNIIDLYGSTAAFEQMFPNITHDEFNTLVEFHKIICNYITITSINQTQ